MSGERNLMNTSATEGSRFASWRKSFLHGDCLPFYLGLGAAVGAVLIAGVGSYFWIDLKIEAQLSTNDFVKTEIARLDRHVNVAKMLKGEIEEFVAPKQIAERLRYSAAASLGVFNFLARELPEGVQLTRVAASEKDLELEGLAISDTHVSSLLKAIEASPFLERPVLVSIGEPAINEQDGRRQRTNRFKIEARLTEALSDIALVSPAAKKVSGASGPASTPSKPGLTASDDGGGQIDILALIAAALVAAGTIFLTMRRWRSRLAIPGLQLASRLERAGAEFKALDTRDLASWGALPRVVIVAEMAAIAAAGIWFGLIDPAVEEFEARQAELPKLKQEWLDKKRLSLNLEEYRRQSSEVETKYESLLKSLPRRQEAAGVSLDIRQVALARGLTVKQPLSTTDETVRDFYAEMPLAVRLAGPFDAIGSFVADLAQTPQVVTIGSFSLAPEGSAGSRGKDMRLQLDASISTYRYLDEDELEKQRTAKRAASKAAKK